MAESMELYEGIITIDPDVCNGRPTIRGQRITVQTVLEYLSAGETPEEILLHYPTLTEKDIKASLGFASKLMGQRYTLQNVA